MQRQLWVNDGLLPTRLRPEGVQFAPREYMEQARRFVYPTSGVEYGYTTWLNTNDPIDPEVASFIGAGDQCVHVSHKEQTVIVSMGSASPGGCESWSLARDYIVSKELPAQWKNVTTGAANNSNSVSVDALRDPLQPPN